MRIFIFISKIGDRCRGQPEGSLFNRYYTEVLGRPLLFSLDSSASPTLYCWELSKKVSSTIFKVFGMTRSGIEPRSPGPLANTLPTRPMSRWKETSTKEVLIECTNSIVQQESSFTITSGHSLRMMNLSIQWIAWNYVLGHCLLTWWKKFFGNRCTENYKEFVEMQLKSLQDIGFNMSIKVHFLHNHQDKFTDNSGDVSDKEGYQNNGRALPGRVGQTSNGWLLLVYQKELQ